MDKLEGKKKISEEDERLQKIFWKQYIEYFNLKNIKPEIANKVNHGVQLKDYIIIKLYQDLETNF